jgi:hypothetical protein
MKTFIMTLFCVLMPLQPSWAGQPRPTPQPDLKVSCTTVLEACQGLIKADDALILQLKANNKILEDKIDAQEAPMIPSWVWYGVVFIAGATAERLLVH